MKKLFNASALCRSLSGWISFSFGFPLPKCFFTGFLFLRIWGWVHELLACSFESGVKLNILVISSVNEVKMTFWPCVYPQLADTKIQFELTRIINIQLQTHLLLLTWLENSLSSSIADLKTFTIEQRTLETGFLGNDSKSGEIPQISWAQKRLQRIWKDISSQCLLRLTLL
jgi:hypothetical protein